MGQMNSVLQKLHQSGLLPMLIQKLKQDQAQPGATPGASPGVGGAPPGGGQARPAPGITQAASSGGGAGPGQGGGPQVKYDPSGAGASMPPPISQPHEAVQSIAGLLMNWNQRKKKGEEAEAANIAQNLIQALRNNDKDTVNDIMNNDHSKKILNKVYKGWLTKMQDAQKPGKEQDPAVSGFEAGIQKATAQPQQGQTQPPRGQLPISSAGGYRMPQAAPGEQLGAAKVSAETQAAKDDPNRLLQSRLTSEEMRETELGAGPEKVAAEKEKAKGVIQKALADVQKAGLEAQKAQTELQIKQTEAQSAKEKGKFSLDIEQKKALEAQIKLDTAKKRLELLATSGGSSKVTPRVKLQWYALGKAETMLNALVGKPPSWRFGQPPQELKELQGQLKMAGLSALASTIPASGFFVNTKEILEFIQEKLGDYKSVFEESYPSLKPEGAPKKAASVSEDAEESDDDEPMEGDVVDGYKFKGGDPSVQSNWELEVKKP